MALRRAEGRKSVAQRTGASIVSSSVKDGCSSAGASISGPSSRKLSVDASLHANAYNNSIDCVDFHAVNHSANGKVNLGEGGKFGVEGGYQMKALGYKVKATDNPLGHVGVDFGNVSVGGAAGLDLQNGKIKAGVSAEVRAVEAKAGPVGAHLGVNVSTGVEASFHDGVPSFSGKILGMGCGFNKDEGLHISTPIGGVNLKWPW